MQDNGGRSVVRSGHRFDNALSLVVGLCRMSRSVVDPQMIPDSNLTAIAVAGESLQRYLSPHCPYLAWQDFRSLRLLFRGQPNEPCSAKKA